MRCFSFRKYLILTFMIILVINFLGKFVVSKLVVDVLSNNKGTFDFFSSNNYMQLDIICLIFLIIALILYFPIKHYYKKIN